MRVSANFHLGQRPSGQVPECGCASVSASVEWGMGRTLLEALSWRVKEFMHVEEQPGTWNGSLCNHGSVVENSVTAFDYYVIVAKRSLALKPASFMCPPVTTRGPRPARDLALRRQEHPWAWTSMS